MGDHTVRGKVFSLPAGESRTSEAWRTFAAIADSVMEVERYNHEFRHGFALKRERKQRSLGDCGSPHEIDSLHSVSCWPIDRTVSREVHEGDSEIARSPENHCIR